MKILKDPSLRRLFLRPALPSRFQQRRWARVQDVLFNDVRYHATHTTQSRVLDKYRDKLNRKAKEEGLADITSLKEAYKARIEAAKRNSITSNPQQESRPKLSPQDSTQVAYPPPPPPSPLSSLQPSESTDADKSRGSGAPIKTLSSYVDVEKIRGLSAKEIENVWRLLHSKSLFSLCAVIPASTYAHISLMARKHPQFVLPVPREGQGAEIHFLQWTFPEEHTATVIFTQLAEYKLRGEYASPHTTLTLHTELSKDKNLVLAQGGVQENRGMTPEDGQWLLMCLQKFYGSQAGVSGESRKLLEQFSSGDPKFEIQRLLDEAERIG